MTEGTALLRAITAFTAMYTSRPQNVQEQLDVMSPRELHELWLNCDALKAEAKKIWRAKVRQGGEYVQDERRYTGMDDPGDAA